MPLQSQLGEENAQFREQIDLMLALLHEQSRLVSEIADTVLAPVLRQNREQMNQIFKTIA